MIIHIYIYYTYYKYNTIIISHYYIPMKIPMISLRLGWSEPLRVACLWRGTFRPRLRALKQLVTFGNPQKG